MELKCDSCGRPIEDIHASYQMKIEIFADPSPPVFTQEDLERDVEAEMHELLKEMATLDPKEAEDEVYEVYVYTLCGKCRKQIHRHLKRKE